MNFKSYLSTWDIDVHCQLLTYITIVYGIFSTQTMLLAVLWIHWRSTVGFTLRLYLKCT